MQDYIEELLDAPLYVLDDESDLDDYLDECADL